LSYEGMIYCRRFISAVPGGSLYTPADRRWSVIFYQAADSTPPPAHQESTAGFHWREKPGTALLLRKCVL